MKRLSATLKDANSAQYVPTDNAPTRSTLMNHSNKFWVLNHATSSCILNSDRVFRTSLEMARSLSTARTFGGGGGVFIN
jgi:hypothetical protein